VTDDDLRDRLTDVVQRAFRWRQDADTVAAAVLPLVRAEIAAAERRGAERAAQAIAAEREAYATQAGRWYDPAYFEGLQRSSQLARAAVPAPTGDNGPLTGGNT
jgi:type II secretory pathway pseudopilin PulG